MIDLRGVKWQTDKLTIILFLTNQFHHLADLNINMTFTFCCTTKHQPDTNHRLLRANTGPALYHQTTHLTGDSGARNVPAEHIPIPALRSPHHNTFQQQQQVQPAQPNHIAQPSPALKSPRRPAQHIAPAPKALDNTRRAQLLHNYHEDSDVVAEEEQERRLREHKEAASAHYTFDSNIQDGINDHAIVRQETRDGLALKGMYSYSDGFFQRTVHYEADEHGYRVTKYVRFLRVWPRAQPIHSKRIANWTHLSLCFSGRTSNPLAMDRFTIQRERLTSRHRFIQAIQLPLMISFENPRRTRLNWRRNYTNFDQFFFTNKEIRKQQKSIQKKRNCKFSQK